MKKIILLFGLTTMVLFSGCGSAEEKEPISCNPWDQEKILVENIEVEDIIVEDIQIEEIVVKPIEIH